MTEKFVQRLSFVLLLQGSVDEATCQQQAEWQQRQAIMAVAHLPMELPISCHQPLPASLLNLMTICTAPVWKLRHAMNSIELLNTHQEVNLTAGAAVSNVATSADNTNDVNIAGHNSYFEQVDLFWQLVTLHRLQQQLQGKLEGMTAISRQQYDSFKSAYQQLVAKPQKNTQPCDHGKQQECSDIASSVPKVLEASAHARLAMTYVESQRAILIAALKAVRCKACEVLSIGSQALCGVGPAKSMLSLPDAHQYTAAAKPGTTGVAAAEQEADNQEEAEADSQSPATKAMPSTQAAPSVEAQLHPILHPGHGVQLLDDDMAMPVGLRICKNLQAGSLLWQLPVAACIIASSQQELVWKTMLQLYSWVKAPNSMVDQPRHWLLQRYQSNATGVSRMAFNDMCMSLLEGTPLSSSVQDAVEDLERSYRQLVGSYGHTAHQQRQSEPHASASLIHGASQITSIHADSEPPAPSSADLPAGTIRSTSDDVSLDADVAKEMLSWHGAFQMFTWAAELAEAGAVQLAAATAKMPTSDEPEPTLFCLVPFKCSLPKVRTLHAPTVPASGVSCSVRSTCLLHSHAAPPFAFVLLALCPMQQASVAYMADCHACRFN